MAVLGIRGVGSFSTDERPQNWREGILFDSPNGDAPLTAIMSKLRSEATDDPRFNWFEKSTPLQRVFINAAAGYSATDTALTIDDGAGADPGKQFKQGHVLINETGDEIMVVTADQTSGTIVTVARGKGEVAANTIADNEALLVVGSMFEEGAGVPTAIGFDPTTQYNYTQIFRTSLNLTRTALRTRLRTASAIREAKREALQLHSIEMERALLFGQRLEETGPDGLPRRATRGIIKWIDSANDFNMGGAVTETAFEDKLEVIFRFGSTEKLFLCGSTALNVLNKLAKSKSTLNTVAGGETYGMHMQEYMTPFGVAYLKMHPLFNQHPVHREWIIIIDLKDVVWRYIDDTGFFVNRQSRGDDARKDEFLTEGGLEVHFGTHHARMTNITSYSA
jgi:hypothetical protein